MVLGELYAVIRDRHGRPAGWEKIPGIRHRGDLTLGERIADSVRNLFGSWKFIIGQTIVVAVWVALNVTAVVHHWDPYPFILLNLAFSTQASYAAPLILLSQKRADQTAAEMAAHDLEQDKLDLECDMRQEKMLHLICEKLGIEVNDDHGARTEGTPARPLGESR